MTGESDLKVAKLTKKKLRKFLAGKYDSAIAEKMLVVLQKAFETNKEGYLMFDEFCSYMSDLINYKTHELLKIAFLIYDFNNDK